MTAACDSRRSPSYGPRPGDVAPPIIQWIPPLIHWDLSDLGPRGGRGIAAEPSSAPRPVVAVVETGASTDSQVRASQHMHDGLHPALT